MNESENKVNLAEIARLHGVNDRLRAEIERLRAMAFNPVTLTDAEREAVAWAVLDSRGTVCVAYTCREEAEAYCEGTANRLSPLYFLPTDWAFLNEQIATLRQRLRQGFFDSLRLTDAEREAVAWAVSAAEDCQHPADDALRGLLERTK